MKKPLLLLLLLASCVTAQTPYLLYHMDDADGLTCVESQNDMDGIYQGATVPHTGVVNTAASFDGNNDYVYTNYRTNNINQTVSLWVKLNGPSIDEYSYFFCNYDATNPFFCLGHRASKGFLVAMRDNLGNSSGYESTVNPASNIWTHLVMMRIGGNVSLWINGTLKSSDTNANAVGSVVGTTTNYTLGASGIPLDETYGGPANATIDEVRFYTSALNSSQIMALYTSESPTTTTLSPLNATNSRYMNELSGGYPIHAVRDVYVDFMGGLAYALFLGILYVGVWLRVRNIIYPTLLLDIVLAAWLWQYIPPEAQTIVYVLNAFLVFMVIYRLSTPVMGE